LWCLQPDTALITAVPNTPGDLNNDGNVDRDDVNWLMQYRNQSADVCPECDIDGDGIITVLDARKTVLLFTCPNGVCD
jgi:hypothetical protein